MKHIPILILSLFFFVSCTSTTQKDPVTGSDFIQKSIEYHDPNNQWATLNATFVFEDSLPAPRESRAYTVSLDNSNSTLSYAIAGTAFTVQHDEITITEGEIEEERALMLRNYYSFLWGLPMKLTDPGLA